MWYTKTNNAAGRSVCKMKYTEMEVLQFCEENDVKFVKLMFCDVFGNLRTISILSGMLSEVFRSGLTFSTSDESGFLGAEYCNLKIFPDPDTMALLPWRPQHGRVVRFFCHVRYEDGTAFEGDGRFFLKNAVDYAAGKGYNFRIGTSCEFYCFEKDQNDRPTDIPLDQAGYCDCAPNDKGENLRRDICLTLEKMDIMPESSRHEHGPGQNEVDFMYASPLQAADNLVTFKNVVKTMADRNGLYASFMPKPLPDTFGSGLHITLMCMKGTENIFDPKLDMLSEEASSMIAGILDRASEITLLLDPTTNSYSRFGDRLAPAYVGWSKANYSQFLRTLKRGRKENGLILRSPDNSCNPYFAIGLLIYACLEGAIENKKLCPPIEKPYSSMSEEEKTALNSLPRDLGEAITKAEKSEFLRDLIPEDFFECYLRNRRRLWSEYQSSEDKQAFDRQHYFNFI